MPHPTSRILRGTRFSGPRRDRASARTLRLTKKDGTSRYRSCARAASGLYGTGPAARSIALLRRCSSDPGRAAPPPPRYLALARSRLSLSLLEARAAWALTTRPWVRRSCLPVRPDLRSRPDRTSAR